MIRFRWIFSDIAEIFCGCGDVGLGCAAVKFKRVIMALRCVRSG